MQVHSKTGGETQEWVRSMLGTVGRGGNAQAVRDEILNIMHRNNIGEKKGTWMEVRLSLMSQEYCSAAWFSPSSKYPSPAVAWVRLCHFFLAAQLDKSWEKVQHFRGHQ